MIFVFGSNEAVGMAKARRSLQERTTGLNTGLRLGAQATPTPYRQRTNNCKRCHLPRLRSMSRNLSGTRSARRTLSMK